MIKEFCDVCEKEIEGRGFTIETEMPSEFTTSVLQHVSLCKKDFDHAVKMLRAEGYPL